MLDVKYQQAADLKISDPEMEWAEIAKTIDVSERQLRRVRSSPEWLEYWKDADKQTMIEILRRKAIAEDNAALMKLYFEVVGILDPAMEEAMLGMSDHEFESEIAYIKAWDAARQI